MREEQEKDLTHVDTTGSADDSRTGGQNELAPLFRIIPMSALIGVLNHALRSHDDWAAMNVPRRIDHGDYFSVQFDRFTRAQVQGAFDYLIGIEVAVEKEPTYRRTRKPRRYRPKAITHE